MLSSTMDAPERDVGIDPAHQSMGLNI